MLGDLIQQGVTQNDFSVTGAMLAGGTMAVMTVLFSYGAFRFPRRLGTILEGDPVVLVERNDRPNLRRNRITVEGAAQARLNAQIAHIDDVEWPSSRRAARSASFRRAVPRLHACRSI